MMEWYEWALAAGAIIAGLLAIRVPRAIFWIALGIISYTLSSWAHNENVPYAAYIGAATDFAICALLFIMARSRWEMRVWHCFNLMVLIDILYSVGVIKDHYDYAVALELANWLAILFIGQAGVSDLASAAFGPRFAWLDRLHSRLYQARSGYFA